MKGILVIVVLGIHSVVHLLLKSSFTVNTSCLSPTNAVVLAEETIIIVGKEKSEL